MLFPLPQLLNSFVSIFSGKELQVDHDPKDCSVKFLHPKIQLASLLRELFPQINLTAWAEFPSHGSSKQDFHRVPDRRIDRHLRSL
jgi:hypothetical protein